MFTRRNFLTHSSLLTSALALTGASLGPRPSHAARGMPRRVVIFIEGNGLRPICMRDPGTLEALAMVAGKPIMSTGDYAHDDPVLVANAPLSEAIALSSLAASPGQISLVERSALVLGLSATYLGGGHSTDFGALTAVRSLGVPSTASIETVLSQIPDVRGMTPFDAIRVGVGASSNPLNYSSCAFGRDKPAPILLDPTATYGSLFGSVASGQVAADFKKRKQLLEFSLEDIERELESLPAAKRGRDKLKTFEDSVLATLMRNETIEGMKAALLAVKPAGPGEADPDLYTSDDPLVQLQLQAGVATAALLSGLTNVAVVSIGSGSYYWASEYPSLVDMYPGKQLMGGHDLRHSGAPEAQDVLNEVSRRGIAEMSRMARALAARPEEGGTMLDNTVLLYMSDNGEKHHSKAEEWAMLMMGGNNMGFQTDGRSVTYPKIGKPNNRQTANMFNSLLHAAGMPTDDFGEGEKQGTLDELWA